ncbi:transglutaminase family protein [Propionivibrio sp.]|uniref:transglutaminase family protein n=1 Tax=Propionivibrio sp. TaxID=2212460 RepID=UPI0025DF80CB|nr:transglutaminase family protein [Propionivibrio sp.]MBK8402384.1 transglutaminase family protein [Propionivibrio sp.]MBK8743538.1 transglutaminase family protein [Propionivibrio sp.]MBK8892843.1 transglutaminase family protein [Propionivibrio sp.]
MSIHVALNHVTHYRYDRLVALSPQVVRLRPAPHSRTPILAYSLKVTPDQHFINWQQDPQGNYLARLVFPEKTREFRIEVDLVAAMSVINPFDFFPESYAEKFPFKYEAGLREELLPFLHTLPPTPLVRRLLDTIPGEPMNSVDFLVDINRRVQQVVSYVIRLEPGVQSPEETLELGSGSCRDSAWLLVEVLRQLGLAARFVSGYLIQLVPDVKSLDGPSGTDVDFTDLHAWCEVFLPGAGWIGLDPTSGLFAGEGHIPVACSPQPSSASPITGFSEECECVFEHSMKIERVWEAPRVTKPYSDEQWTLIESLGHHIDADLANGDVRLTMGGEPTFVAIDDPDGAEWSTAAMGPTKRIRAADLFHRLREKYAPQGLVHFGQGKWYPGEPLPRWSLNCFWRRDGQPVWKNPALCADESQDYGADAALAGRFLRAFAERLRLAAKYVFPAYEDAFYYLWREHRLPVNVDPHAARLEDPLERARLAEIFGKGLDKVVGYVLPVMRHPKQKGRWQTSPWFLRGDRCFLVPGDSPVGFRLPLESQPWVAKSDYPYTHAPDPTQDFEPLPEHAELHAATSATIGEGSPAHGDSDRPPKYQESASDITRTAISVQARGGVLYIFMPPTDCLDDYLELVAAVEATAEALSTPVIVEGYEPPSDPRLTNFRVTPDPGVIEVNIQPCASWDELVERTTHLYEVAHLSRLTSEKFMLDGRHTGTGGGNHFVFGALTALDSPFLRRPDLLRSLISYWHNHPSLSYLFSGLFIGPTSQAPRVDEARNDSVYELEIAFSQFPEPGKEVAPWLIDRLLRNLLIDATGNTHRAEFCIDKLYSPNGPTGRLGLLEMRAFEMPPHARMSLAQQLLLRALIARFWKQPYAPARLIRWGTELHDRFMLPHFVKQDFDDVIGELREAGYAMESEWFAPHFEFRFPLHGSFLAEGIHFELRHALEPWHVMGEEGGAGGNVRYVDASCERVQVKVSGMSGDRYVLTCNGKAIPLQPTGNVGEFVAGVRYRAWLPESSLHPTIGVHAPLVFDLVDTWMKRSLGGCQYHVEHPGGRNPERYPVNANEAEGRRLARFMAIGHTPGRIDVPDAPRNRTFPFTLDLRQS